MSDPVYYPLKAIVHVAVAEGWREGRVVGRTLEQDARYDIRFADGSLERNVAAARIRLAS